MSQRDESSWWDRAVISGHDGGQGVPWAGMPAAVAAVGASAAEAVAQRATEDDPAAAVLLSDGELLSRLEF